MTRHDRPGDCWEEALAAMRQEWGGFYVIAYDDAPGAGSPGWRAWRLDSIGVVLDAKTPGELDAAIRADAEARGGT